MKAFNLKVVDAKNWKFADADDDEATAATAGPIPPTTPGKKRGRPKKDDSPDAKREKVATLKKNGPAEGDIKKDKILEDEAKQDDEAAEAEGE
jgi:hypothetical protein